MNNNLKKISTVAIAIFAIILNTCACDYSYSQSKSFQIDTPKNNAQFPQKFVTNLENQPKSQNDTAQTRPVKQSSGQITSLPWENSDEFRAAVEKNNTPVLLAGYQTVLKDPLPGEEENVHLAARLLQGTIVKPQETFSQNNKIGPYTTERGFQKGPTYIGSTLTTTIGGGVCKIASTLYNVAILSNLSIVERHPHSMPVPYVPYGQDATVAYGSRDFKFLNNASSPIMIWAEGIDNTLYIGFYGQAKPPKVEWHHQTLEVYKANKIYKANPKLPPGTEKYILEGMDGALVKSWITIENTDGSKTEKQLGNSYYKPMPYIVERNESQQ